MTAPQTLHVDEVVHIATWHNLVITDCAGDMTVEHLRVLGQAYRTIAEQYPNRVLGLALLRPQTPVASSEARAEANRFMRELGSNLQHITMVIEGRGVLAQMLTTVVRGINVISRGSRVSLASDTAEAVRAFLPLLEPAGVGGQNGRELVSAITVVRCALSARVPAFTPRY